MEGTQNPQKRKSAAALAVLTAAALFWMARPAFAQLFPQVAPNGVGDLLIYQLWITTDPNDPQGTTGVPRDTLIALIHPFGGQNQFVHVRVREGVRSNDVRDFTVCLSPGDVWTAAISPRSGVRGQSQLVVANPGSCDATVAKAGFTPPPVPGVVVPIPATFGYIEAFTLPTAGEPVGRDVIMGVATLVNVQAGFSSSWNPVALVGFNGRSENDSTLTNKRTLVSQALAREGGVDKEVLLARWNANPEIGAETQLVFTFPAGFQPGTGDLVSVWLFDEDERFNFSPREVEFPWEVNFCNFSFNAATRFAQFGCTGGSNRILEITAPTPTGTILQGWARFINNTAGGSDELDNIDAPPVSRFPVTAISFANFKNADDDFDQSFGFQWAAIRGVGGVGGAICAAGPAGCNSFNLSGPLSGTFAPWFNASAGLVFPGDNVTAALNRTGTSAP
jgi:hypothetical protein